MSSAKSAVLRSTAASLAESNRNARLARRRIADLHKLRLEPLTSRDGVCDGEGGARLVRLLLPRRLARALVRARRFLARVGARRVRGGGARFARGERVERALEALLLLGGRRLCASSQSSLGAGRLARSLARSLTRERVCGWADGRSRGAVRYHVGRGGGPCECGLGAMRREPRCALAGYRVTGP